MNKMKLKNILGILGFVALIATVYVNQNTKISKDIDLASLVATASAAGEEAFDRDLCSAEPNHTCIVNGGGRFFHSDRCEPDTWYTLADCL